MTGVSSPYILSGLEPENSESYEQEEKRESQKTLDIDLGLYQLCESD
jgi:hypothetical protein